MVSKKPAGIRHRFLLLQIFPKTRIGGCGRKVGLSRRYFIHIYEERMRALELYIKLGKRVRATIRELGYPTKNTLMGWYRE